MNYIYAFLLAGFACAIAEVILDNTKLTPGHITSIFTSLGAFLSFLGVYDKLIEKCGGGATTLISNFGHSLYSSAIKGYYEEGFLGIFSYMLTKSSFVICSAVICGFIVALLFKAKD